MLIGSAMEYISLLMKSVSKSFWFVWDGEVGL